MQRANWRGIGAFVAGVASLLLVAGCTQKKAPPASGPAFSRAPAEPDASGPGIVLPEKWNTPDGMTTDAEGNILVSVPNFNDWKDKQPIIARIDENDQVSEWFKLPLHPETKRVCPLGIAFGSDGNLYIADSQALGGKEGPYSRLLRIVVENGEPVRCETLVDGFFFSNGVACRGDAVFVAETSLGIKAAEGEPHESGVYMFELDELDPADPIKLEPDGNDEHLIHTLETKSEDWKVGANGLAFGPDGTMYVCNFGDAQVLEVKLDEYGNVESDKVLVEGQGMKSCDGLQFHKDSGKLYVADFLGNAVHEIDPKAGKVTTVRADPEINDGSGNKLDRPSECHRRGNKIYASNIDLSLAGNEYDKPHTITVIEVE